MDKAKDEAINKLIVGQEKMGKEIAEIRVDIKEIRGDITDLKQGQKNLEADVSDLKQGQKQTNDLIFKVLDNIARLERIVVVNLQNDLRTKVDTLSDADKVRQHETTDLKQICREQAERLEDHEIRISRLEKD